MTPDWTSDDGRHQLYHADCLDVLPTLGLGVDAIVTDPPYGIGEAAGKNKSRGFLAVSRDYGNESWDDTPASPQAIAECRRVSRWQIIFGGNYYELPPTKCWLVWDKENGKTDFADCELAWTNLPIAVRRIRFMWHGMLRKNGESRGDHPTQKPIGVMQWAMGWLPHGDVICDPFAGSGTTGIACIRTGRRFIGVEKERKYFDIAVKRMESELAQGRLFEQEQQA